MTACAVGISNNDIHGGDVIDSRDVQYAIEQLTGLPERDEFEDAALASLQALKDAICDALGNNWDDGLLLVRDEYFEEYAEDYARSTEPLERDSWLWNYVDFGNLADDLKSDYRRIDLGGITYYARGY
jgi:hypothetical protein